MLGLNTASAWPRSIAAAVIVAGAAASLLVNYPGHIEFDGIMQMAEGHTAVYSNWHPPVMSWLLGIAYAVRGDAWLFVLVDSLMGFGALLSLLWLVAKPRWPAVSMAIACAALPQFFLFSAIVWKDVLFADAALAGFACVAHAAVRWRFFRARFLLLGAAAVLISLAVLARQNGVFALPCAAMAVGLIAARAASNDGRQGFIYGLGFLMVGAFLSLGTNALLQMRASTAPGSVEQFEDLEIYDMGGMLKRQPGLPLTVLEHQAPGMARALRDKGPELYTPAIHDPLTGTPQIRSRLKASVAAVRGQWARLVPSHPLLYLGVRATDFSWLFFSRHPDRCLTYTLGVNGPAAQMNMLMLTQRYDDRDEWLEDHYAQPLIGTPAFSHPFFAAIGAIALVLLLRRRRPADVALAALLTTSLLYAASYFFISVACQYRYLLVIDTSSLAAIFYLSLDLSGFRRTFSPPSGAR